jgi:hypothetical protein
MQQQPNSFQSVQGRGTLRSIHGFNNFFRNGRFVLSGLIMMSMFSCICMVAYRLMQDAQNGVTTDGPGFTFGVIGVMILLSLFIIFYMIGDWLKNRAYSAAVFEGGLAIQDQKGNLHTVGWRDIDHTQRVRLPRSRSHNYKVITRDGRILVLYYFLSGLNDLWNSIQQAITLQS